MNDQYNHDHEVRSLVGNTLDRGVRLAKKAVRFLLAKLTAVIKTAVIALFIVVLLFSVAYGIVFQYPRMAMEKQGEAISPHFALNNEHEEYQQLNKAYDAQAERYKEGLTAFEQDQVAEHKLTKGIMLAVDQILGDPLFTGKKQWESIGPEKIYNALKPHFVWKNSTITRTVTYEDVVIEEKVVYENRVRTVTKTEYREEKRLVKVRDYIDERHYREYYEWQTVQVPYTVEEVVTEKVPVTISEEKRVVKTKEFTETVRLLSTAETLEGKFVYNYDTVENEITDFSEPYYGLTNIISIKEEKEELRSVVLEPPYFERLKEFTDEHGIGDLDLDSIVILAMGYDPMFERRVYEYGMELQTFDLYDSNFSIYNGPRTNIDGVIWPLPPEYTRITSHYGWRILRGQRNWHGGMDIGVPVGQPVFSVLNGEVVHAGWAGAYGYLVIVSHGDYGNGNVTTYYAHLANTRAKKGQKVEAGDVIGLSGNTGNSTGPHLHFEYRVNNEKLDPAKYLFKIR